MVIEYDSFFSKVIARSSFLERFVLTLGQNIVKGRQLSNYVIKNESFSFKLFETMVIMAHYSFLTHMHIKKLKLKIHLIQF
jgi:hypothetical protein